MPASGNIAAASASTPIRPRCAGPAASGSRPSPTRIGLDARAKHWNAIAEPMHAELLERAWNAKRGAFTAAFGSDDLDASVLLAARPRRRRGRRSALCLHGRRHGARTGARKARHALCRRRRFRDAGDRVPDLPVLADRRAVVARPARGGARPVHRRAASTATATVCCPKTSIRRPARCGAISRRPIRWPASSSRRCGCRAAGKTAIGAGDPEPDLAAAPYRAVLVTIGGGAVSAAGALGEKASVTHAFQPDGRLSASNSQYDLKFR